MSVALHESDINVGHDKLFFVLVAHPKILHLDTFLSPVYKDVHVDSSHIHGHVHTHVYVHQCI